MYTRIIKIYTKNDKSVHEPEKLIRFDLIPKPVAISRSDSATLH